MAQTSLAGFMNAGGSGQVPLSGTPSPSAGNVDTVASQGNFRTARPGTVGVLSGTPSFDPAAQGGNSTGAQTTPGAGNVFIPGIGLQNQPGGVTAQTTPNPASNNGTPPVVKGAATPPPSTVDPGYAAMAKQFTPGSVLYNEIMGYANNPSAAATAQGQANIAGALATPYLTGSQEAAVRSAQAAGTQPPTFAANTGVPPGVSAALGGTPARPNTPGASSTLAGQPAPGTPPATPGNQPNNSSVQQFLQYWQALQQFLGAGGGTPSGGGGGGYNAGSDPTMAAIYSMLFGGGQGYNPYGLPLYTRQRMQWPMFP